jgi:hypothetical protein
VGRKDALELLVEVLYCQRTQFVEEAVHFHTGIRVGYFPRLVAIRVQLRIWQQARTFAAL